jgi:hypothetical protein
MKGMETTPHPVPMLVVVATIVTAIKLFLKE